MTDADTKTYGNPPGNRLLSGPPKHTFGMYRNTWELSICGHHHKEEIFFTPSPRSRRTKNKYILFYLIGRPAGWIHKTLRTWKYKEHCMTFRFDIREFSLFLAQLQKSNHPAETP